MTGSMFTDRDRALFIDLERASQTTGARLYMIGAGAIQLGPARTWETRPRMTRDWDFAVRLADWSAFSGLVAELTSPVGGFERAPEEHRFWHRDGGVMDIIPFGGLTDAQGVLHWPGGQSMRTDGLHLLEAHHEFVHVDDVEVRIATLPLLVALKLLAYLERRPGVVRDIQDAHRMFMEVEAAFDIRQVDSGDESTWELIGDGTLGILDLGAYSLGRDVGAMLSTTELGLVQELCRAAQREESNVAPDVMRGHDASSFDRRAVVRRFGAFGLGLATEVGLK